jgi:hypothetical protein
MKTTAGGTDGGPPAGDGARSAVSAGPHGRVDMIGDPMFDQLLYSLGWLIQLPLMLIGVIEWF